METGSQLVVNEHPRNVRAIVPTFALGSSSFWALLSAIVRSRRPCNVRVLRALALFFCALALFASPRAARAAPFDLQGRDWEGASDFIAIAKGEIGAARVVPDGAARLPRLEARGLAHPLHPERTLDTESLAQFMRAGGRVILLDDYGTGDALLTHFGIERVPAPRTPRALRNNPALAIAEPASAHPVSHDVVARRHEPPDRVSTIRTCRRSSKIRGDRRAGRAPRASRARSGKGRLLAVGDPSIVMNSMLRYPGNKAFARGLVQLRRRRRHAGASAERQALHRRPARSSERGSFGDDGAFGDDSSERLRALEDALARCAARRVPAALAYSSPRSRGSASSCGSARARRGRIKPARRASRAPIPLVAQGGVAGHAAVIAAPHTSRVLAMLELKSALEEGLAPLLGLDEMPEHESCSRNWRRAAMARRRRCLRTLKRFCYDYASIETMVLSSARAPATAPRARSRRARARDGSWHGDARIATMRCGARAGAARPAQDARRRRAPMSAVAHERDRRGEGAHRRPPARGDARVHRLDDARST